MSAPPAAASPAAASPAAAGALLGSSGPLFLRKAGSDEPAQLTAVAALLGVATACMGTAYAKLLKASVTLTWKTAPALLPPGLDPTLFVPAVCTLGGALVGLLAVNLPSTTMADFIGTQNGQRSLPGLRPVRRAQNVQTLAAAEPWRGSTPRQPRGLPEGLWRAHFPRIIARTGPPHLGMPARSPLHTNC